MQWEREDWPHRFLGGKACQHTASEKKKLLEVLSQKVCFCHTQRKLARLLCCTGISSTPKFSTMTWAQTNPFTQARWPAASTEWKTAWHEFEKYLNNTGEDAENQAATTRRRRANSANTGTRKNQSRQTKDDLEDAMDDLNRSTKSLRRKFDATSNYLETKKTSANRWALVRSRRPRIRVTRSAEIHWRRDRPQRENDNPPSCLGRSSGLAGG